MLLTKVRGATSYENIKMIEGVQYKTFKDAAIALGLYADDTEWHNCLIEAGKVITNIQNILVMAKSPYLQMNFIMI